MRQAGRYLPEYKAIRKEHSMMQCLLSAELATEITLQPIRRFNFDAAIIFADILTPLRCLGIEVDFKDDVGPVLSNIPESPALIAKALGSPDLSPLNATFEALRAVRHELASKSTTLIGFSGAPFTLATYLLDRPKGTQSELLATKKLMLAEPEVWAQLQDRLVSLSAKYLVEQTKAGAEVLQIFDSWVGALSAPQFEQNVAPFLSRLISEVRKSTDVPLIYFGTNTAMLLPAINSLPVTAVGVDWRIPLTAAANQLPEKCVQGNLDPAYLFASEADLRLEVDRILMESRKIGAHIFNLGHGINQHTDPSKVEILCDAVRRG